MYTEPETLTSDAADRCTGFTRLLDMYTTEARACGQDQARTYWINKKIALFQAADRDHVPARDLGVGWSIRTYGPAGTPLAVTVQTVVTTHLRTVVTHSYGTLVVGPDTRVETYLQGPTAQDPLPVESDYSPGLLTAA